MSIRVYLDGSVESQKDMGRFPDVTLHSDNGCPYFVLRSLADSFDPALNQFINKVTLFEQLPSKPKRIEGVYKDDHGTDARLGYIPQTDNYSLLISGKTTSDVDALYRLVRAGTVQPAENWEAAQEGADEPPEQTEEEVAEEEARHLEVYFMGYTPAPRHVCDYESLLEVARTLDTILAYAVEGDGGVLYFDGTHFYAQPIEYSSSPPVRLHEVSDTMAYEAIGYLAVYSIGIKHDDVRHMQEGTFYYPYMSITIPLHVSFFPHRGDLLATIRFPSRQNVGLLNDATDQRVYPFSSPGDPFDISIDPEAAGLLSEDEMHEFKCLVVAKENDVCFGGEDILRVATSQRFENLAEAVELIRDVYMRVGLGDNQEPPIALFQVNSGVFHQLLELYRGPTSKKP